MAMTELAQAHNIKVVLCSVMPISDYPSLNPQPVAGRGGAPAPVRRRQTEIRPPADILKLNAWLKEYAAKVHAVYADYFAATVDEKGWLKEAISGDGLHPNAQGYALMAPVVEAAIQKALQ
jgi:lysophospholipase L1-like esterase